MSEAGQTSHWGIIGGGMLGVTLAHRLTQQGKRVTLIEAASHLGGLASAWQVGDLVWDRHYHVTLLAFLPQAGCTRFPTRSSCCVFRCSAGWT